MFNYKKMTAPQGQLCSYKNCKKDGAYKAPLSRGQNPQYTWLCLEHIREHNANWDYLAGCDETQIEQKIKDSTVWERPTWPLSQGPRLYPKARPSANTNMIPKNVQEAAKQLNLKPPYSKHKTKEQYRMLAKKYHPDANGGKEDDVKRFYELQNAFQTMQDYLESKD